MKPRSSWKRPPCSHEGCKRRSKATHECITCEKLGRDPVYRVHACGYHQQQVLALIKRHALVKHPANMLRAGVAALKGEDVF